MEEEVIGPWKEEKRFPKVLAALRAHRGSSFYISGPKTRETSHQLQGIEHERRKDWMRSNKRRVGAKSYEFTLKPL